MKNARTFTLVPALSDPPPRAAHPAGSLGRALGFRMFWRLLALAVGIVLAQIAVHAARSTAPVGRSVAAMAAGAATGRAPGAAAASNGPFRDQDSCDPAGEPIECR